MKQKFPAGENKVSPAGNKSFPCMKLKRYYHQTEEKACYIIGESAIYLYLCLTIIIN